MRKFYYDLGKSIYRIDGAYSIFTKNSEVSSSMLWFLYAINDENQHTQRQICKDWNMKKTTINTLVKECEKKGYILLKPIPKEKREMIIELTNEGRIFANQVLSPVYEAEKRFYEQFSKEHDMKFMKEFIEFANQLSKYIEGFKYDEE